MGRRTEVRTAARMQVLVRGADSDGSPFSVTAHARDVSGSGACLIGLQGLVVPGTKLEIEYQGRKARYRVQWIGKAGSAQANQVGLRCLEPGNYIWGVELPEWAEDNYDPSQAPISRDVPADTHSGNGNQPAREERRAFPRRPCRFEALVTEEGTDVSLPAKVTDISLGGCYLEMLSPLPVDALIDLTMNPSNMTLKMNGRVRTSQTGMGMGVEFTGLTPGEFEKLRKIAPPDSGTPHQAKQPSRQRREIADPVMELQLEIEHGHRGPTSASALTNAVQSSTADALEAILRVLSRRGVISRGEVAEELQKLLTAKS